METLFKPTLEAPLTTARRFIKRFPFGELTVEQLDIWIIDQRLAEDPETDDTRSPRYREFRDARNKVRNMLNRHGGDCDDGQRFHIKVQVNGKLYEIIPYLVAELDRARDFGPEVARLMSSKSIKLIKAERKLAERAMYEGADQKSLLKARRVISMLNEQSEKTTRQMRALLHKKSMDDDAAAVLIEKLMLSHQKEEV